MSDNSTSAQSSSVHQGPLAAEDYTGQTRLAYLRLVSGGVLLVSVVISFVLGRWFAPVSR